MKRIIAITLTFAMCLAVLLTATSCGANDNALKKYIEKNGCDGLTLTIKWVPLKVLFPKPLSIDEIKTITDKIIEVDGKELSEHIDLITSLATTKPKDAGEVEGVDARLYYVFKTADGEELFEVCMGSIDRETGEMRYIVNGKMVHFDKIYFDVIRPFLTEEFDQDFSYIR